MEENKKRMTKQEKAEHSYFRAEAVWKEFVSQNGNVTMSELAEKFKCSAYQVSVILTTKLKMKFKHNEKQENDESL